MRRFLLLSLVTTVTIAVPAFADEAAVKKMIGDYANAFNAKQLDTVISYWTENGVHVDRDTGERTEGRDAIRADIANSFSSTSQAIESLVALKACGSSSPMSRTSTEA